MKIISVNISLVINVISPYKWSESLLVMLILDVSIYSLVINATSVNAYLVQIIVCVNISLVMYVLKMNHSLEI